MKDSSCGEYTTYSQKVRNLMYSIIYYRGILNYSNMESSNLKVIFKIEGFLERLSKYKNTISDNCKTALMNIRKIRSYNGRSLFKKEKKQLNSEDIDTIRGIIDELIEIINEELPKEEELDEIEKVLINKEYSNKQLGEAFRNHAREIVYILCDKDNAKNKINEQSIGDNNPLISIIAQNISQEKKTDKIQELIKSEQFLNLGGAIARCSRKIAQVISKEIQLEENQSSHNGEAIGTEGGTNR